MAVKRHQVDLSIKKKIYDDAMRRMRKLQRQEREQHGVKRTNLADIGREAIMRYKPSDGANYEPRIVRSPAGAKPRREPFRFDIASQAYERKKNLITNNGHRVTQVVEEALKRFAETGRMPGDDEPEPEQEAPATGPQAVSFSN